MKEFDLEFNVGTMLSHRPSIQIQAGNKQSVLVSIQKIKIISMKNQKPRG